MKIAALVDDVSMFSRRAHWRWLKRRARVILCCSRVREELFIIGVAKNMRCYGNSADESDEDDDLIMGSIRIM